MLLDQRVEEGSLHDVGGGSGSARNEAGSMAARRTASTLSERAPNDSARIPIAMERSAGLSTDTSEAASNRYFELLRRRTPAMRRVMLAGLVASVRQLAESGVRAAFPDATDREVMARVAVRLYGLEVAERLFPDVTLR